MSEELENTKRGTPEALIEDMFLQRLSPRGASSRVAPHDVGVASAHISL